MAWDLLIDWTVREREEKEVKDGSKGFGINNWEEGDDPPWKTHN